jgi:hypothetical protein
MALQLKRKCFPIAIDNGKDYLNLSYLLNKKETGIAQILLPKEGEIVKKTKDMVSSWRGKKFSKDDARAFYSWLDKYVKDSYAELGVR